MKNLFILSAILWMFAPAIYADGNPNLTSQLIQKALSVDDFVADNAIKELRGMGQAGLDAFLEENREALAGQDRSEVMFIHSRMDRIAGQKDSYYSRLFWYTDIIEAKIAAAEAQKPILSLRMLGKLTDDLSCANSRLFRTVLYGNETVSRYLRENYILHWSSERPVPVVTIDYGDGRVMKRTLAGNSIHYVMHPNGEIIDAIPGLYAPAAFIEQLNTANEVYQVVSLMTPADRTEFITSYHVSALTRLAPLSRISEMDIYSPETHPLLPTIKEAENLTVAKASNENPILDDLNSRTYIRRPNTPQTKKVLSPTGKKALEEQNKRIKEAEKNPRTGWQETINQLEIISEIDVASMKMMRDKNPERYGDMELLDLAVSRLEEAMELETARNEVQLHYAIHNLMQDPAYQTNFDLLNNEIYSAYFLTPQADPWLGMLPADVYTGLDNDGIVRQ